MVWFWIQFFRGAPYFFYQIKKTTKRSTPKSAPFCHIILWKTVTY